ncbi:MAG TPA: phosphoribosylformylglycinamidine cyclo-ligase [Abditibacteriaceae bacterium]|jgi:phosphoribosylformylglycinamidine cyclo-ligase
MSETSNPTTQYSTYASAGVDIEAGNETVRRIKPHAQRTFTPGVLGGIGGFGALFQHDFSQYAEPVLVSSTDGVGTKLKLAFTLNKHDTVGIDLVAMCANDVLCAGARPLFFLDYFATGKLAPEIAEDVVKGIADGCVETGCALIGGETAELPGFYTEGEYDLAGFCVGVADKAKIIDGSTVKPGDVILGLASSGLHSNGYSLARKVLEPLGYDSHNDELGATVGEAMLRPTRLYVKPVLAMLETVTAKAIVHITGGGFYENIPRALPAGTKASIRRDSWPVTPLFKLIQSRAGIEEREMYTTFNMGIGLVVVVSAEDAEAAKTSLAAQGVQVFQIGSIESTSDAARVELI